jgi:site-specific recombinase XerD
MLICVIYDIVYVAQIQKHSGIDSFLESVYVRSHSLNTVNNYRTSIGNFQKFVQERYSCTDNELVTKIRNNEYDVYKILRDFVCYLDGLKYRAASIKLKLAAIKGYLRELGLKIYSEDFKQVVKMPRNVVVRDEAVTKEMLLRLLHNAPAKLQTAILVATSSGMRVGELVQIKISDVDFNSKPTRIRIRAEITKTREARETYLTNEAVISLKDYLKRYFGWEDGQSNESIRDRANDEEYGIEGSCLEIRSTCASFGRSQLTQKLHHPWQYTHQFVPESLPEYVVIPCVGHHY